MLVQIYLLISEEKSLDISNLSEEFEKAVSEEVHAQ